MQWSSLAANRIAACTRERALRPRRRASRRRTWSGASRERAHDAVDLRLEAHVEHPVGLVEDEDATASSVIALRSSRSLRRPGVATTTCALRARLAWRGSGRPVDRRDLDAARRDRGDLERNLRRELARGYENERRRTSIADVQSLDDRNGEAQRLAGSGRSLGEDVPSGKRVAKDVRWIGKGVLMSRSASRPTMRVGTPSSEKDCCISIQLLCLAGSRSVCLDP
jgi:hypothetical protein